MPVSFVRSGKKLRASDLQRVEDKLGAILPTDYSKFVSKHNGGSPKPACFPCRIRKYRQDDIGHLWVSWFNRIDENLATPNDKAPYDTLSFQLARFGESFSHHFVPIGKVADEHLLLLAIKGARQGQVWLKWMGELDPLASLKKQKTVGLYKVADSFEALLLQLSDGACQRL